MNFKTI